jgi:hypothetical protein
MKVTIQDDAALFEHEDIVVGEYVLNDPFKPHFRSLKTPAGHETTLVSPGDHRHHKGMMYALRCEDLNFWEETPGKQCGVQRILNTRLNDAGDGINQDLLWMDDGGQNRTYREHREIRARFDAQSSAIVYVWKTRREALRDHALVKSPWSMEVPDGRRINYHGLGIRLPWMWRFPLAPFCGVEANREAVDPMQACGSNGPSVGFWGLVDGCWDRTVASVTFSQPAKQAFTWFVLKGEFPYLAVGPSNSEGFAVRTCDTFEETFTVEVADRSPDLGRSRSDLTQ